MPTPNQSPAPEHTPLTDIALPLRVNRDNEQIGDICDANDRQLLQVQMQGTLKRLDNAKRERVAEQVVRAVNALPAAVEALEIACRRIEGFDADGNLTDGICFSDEDRETIAAALRALKPE